MKNTQNTVPNVANLYFLEDDNSSIVDTTTSIQTLVQAFEKRAMQNPGTAYRFRKLVGDKLYEVDDSELPDEFLQNATAYNCDDHEDCDFHHYYGHKGDFVNQAV